MVLLEVQWVPNKSIENCDPRLFHLEKLELRILVISFDNYFLSQSRKNWEYLVRIIPALFYPVLTIPLILEICRIRVKKKNNKVSDNTIFLIFFMTLSFMVSEGFAGVASYLMTAKWANRIDNLVSTAHTASQVFDNLRALNALSHFFVCFLMSSQYRSTVYGVFQCCKSKKKKITMVPAKEDEVFDRINSRITM